MKQHQTLLEGVKKVLENEEELKAICMHKKNNIDEIMNERKLKWQLQQLINEAKSTEDRRYRFLLSLFLSLHLLPLSLLSLGYIRSAVWFLGPDLLSLFLLSRSSFLMNICYSHLATVLLWAFAVLQWRPT